MPLNAQSQGYIPGAELVTNHNGHHYPSSLSQHQRQTSQTQPTMRCSSQHPPVPVSQPSHHAGQVNTTLNPNARRPPASVSQYHQYLVQCEATAKHQGERPSAPTPVPQAGMGHWVRNVPKAHPAYVVQHGNRYFDHRGQSRQPTSNHIQHTHNQSKSQGFTLLDGSNSSGSYRDRQSVGTNQPSRSVNGHRATGPAQIVTPDPRPWQVNRAASVTGPVPAVDMRERQAMIAGLKRLEMLERRFSDLEEHHARSLVDLKDDLVQRLLAVEKKYEERLAASQANELTRYRDVSGLPSTIFRQDIRALAAGEIGRPHNSVRSARLSCGRKSQGLDETATAPPTQSDKSTVPCHHADNVRDSIELRSDVDKTNITPCRELQERNVSNGRVGSVRRRSNGESPKPCARRYNMRTRVQGRVQKIVKRGL